MVDSLIKILIRQNKNSYIEQGACFVPRQSIIIIKRFQNILYWPVFST